MNPLGIFTTVYGRASLLEMARAIQGHGMRFVHLDPRYPPIQTGGGIPTAARAREVRQILADHQIAIAALAGYTNLVHADLTAREAGLEAFERLIDLCAEFGTRYIATETGSLHPENPWEDHPNNRTPEAWAALKGALERLLRRARPAGVTILLEGYVNNVLATTEQAARLVDELGPEGLGFVLDPFNYFTREDMAAPAAALDRIFGAIAQRAPIAHAKDVVYTERGIETPKAGAGRMDWPAFAARLLRERPHVPLILEHLRAEEIPACKAFIEAAFARAEGEGAASGL
ncbi:MAG TPA: sugar phosphate isomerase/epimerase family protein [Limnochordia bacterium]